MSDCCKELLKKEPFFQRSTPAIGPVISGKWAFHLQDTHGIPVELLPDMVKITVEKKMISGGTK